MDKLTKIKQILLNGHGSPLQRLEAAVHEIEVWEALAAAENTGWCFDMEKAGVKTWTDVGAALDSIKEARIAVEVACGARVKGPKEYPLEDHYGTLNQALLSLEWQVKAFASSPAPPTKKEG